MFEDFVAKYCVGCNHHVAEMFEHDKYASYCDLHKCWITSKNNGCKEHTNLKNMNKEQINKIINDRLDYFIRGCERGFISQKELDDMRYAISKVQEDLNNAIKNEITTKS